MRAERACSGQARDLLDQVKKETAVAICHRAQCGTAVTGQREDMGEVLLGSTEQCLEVKFLHDHSPDKAAPKELTWVQIDVYGKRNEIAISSAGNKLRSENFTWQADGSAVVAFKNPGGGAEALQALAVVEAVLIQKSRL